MYETLDPKEDNASLSAPALTQQIFASAGSGNAASTGYEDERVFQVCFSFCAREEIDA